MFRFRIRDELDGSCVSISNRARRFDRVAGQLFSKGRGRKQGSALPR